MVWGPFHYNGFFARNSNSMETSPCHNSVAGHQITTIFCTCHDSTAVVQCTKFCSDHCVRIGLRVKRNFHRIWIAMGKPLVKRAPVQQGSTLFTFTWHFHWFSLHLQMARVRHLMVPAESHTISVELRSLSRREMTTSRCVSEQIHQRACCCLRTRIKEIISL